MKYMQLKNKRSKVQLILLFFIFIIVLSGSSSPEENKNSKEVFIPISKIVKKFNLKVEDDTILSIYKIYRGNRKVILIPVENTIVIGDRIYHSVLKMDKGILYVDGYGVDLIIKGLIGKRLKWNYRNGLFLVGKELSVKARSKNITSKQQRYRPYIRAVIIDPGHGGKDPGGIGYKNIKEKDIVLNIAKFVVSEIKKRNRGIKIIITRDDDRFVSLEERAKIANRVDSKLNPIYISIHANVSFNRATMGYESYYLTINPKDEEARKVADKENSVINYEDIKNKRYLEDIINHIVDIEYRRESIRLAEDIQKSISKKIDSLSIDRGVKGAYFYVLKSVKMPSVLLEIGFITNKIEAKNLSSVNYQKKLAQGIVDGIEKFIKEFETTEGFTNNIVNQE